MKNNVIIIFSDNSGGVKSTSDTLNKAFNEENISSKLLNMKNKKGRLISRLFRTLSDVKKEKESIILLMHFEAIFLGIFLYLIGFKKIVNIVHTDLYEYYQSVNPIKKLIIRILFTLNKKKETIFVSKEAEIRAKNFFKLKKTHCIYNIINLNNITKQSKVNNKTPIKLGIVSRLHTKKNIDYAIKLINELNNRNERVILFIYGSGDEYDKLKKFNSSLTHSDKIKFLGHSANKNEIFNSFDGLISFSSIEGLPTIILESFSFKKPVLFTDCHSGPRELIAPKTNPIIKTNSFEISTLGFLVKPLRKESNYSIDISDDDMVYIEALRLFITYIKDSSFNMNYDYSLFSKEAIIQEWKNVFQKLNQLTT